MSKIKRLLSLDVGSARIGVALAESGVRIAVPQDHIDVDGREIEMIARLVVRDGITDIIIGYPRNQSGDATAQTTEVETFAERLKDLGVAISFQDESLTSVMAERRLVDRGEPFTKGDIDSEAAAIILQDYLEQQR